MIVQCVGDCPEGIAHEKINRTYARGSAHHNTAETSAKGLQQSAIRHLGHAQLHVLRKSISQDSLANSKRTCLGEGAAGEQHLSAQLLSGAQHDGAGPTGLRLRAPSRRLLLLDGLDHRHQVCQGLAAA